jgi:hypothetical protein
MDEYPPLSPRIGQQSMSFDTKTQDVVPMSPSRSRSKNAALIQHRKTTPPYSTSGISNRSSMSEDSTGTTAFMPVNAALHLSLSSSSPLSSSGTSSTYELSPSDSIVLSKHECTEEAPGYSTSKIHTPERAQKRNTTIFNLQSLTPFQIQRETSSGYGEQQSSPSKHRRPPPRGLRDPVLQWSKLFSLRQHKFLCTLLMLAVGLGMNSFFMLHKAVKNNWDSRWAYDKNSVEAQTKLVGIFSIRGNTTTNPATDDGRESASHSINPSPPRVWNLGAGLYDEPTEIAASYRVLDQYPSEYSDVTQRYPHMDSGDQAFKKGILPVQFLVNPYENDECVPFSDWQTSHAPSCNNFHEMDLISKNQFTLFGTKGYWRHAWKVRNDMFNNSTTSTYNKNLPKNSVLKTLRYEHNYEQEFYHFNQIDAMVMERLTASPYVMDVYGFCGNSALTEFASTTMNQFRKKSDLSSWERLKLSRKIALGLEDVHSIDGDFNVTVVHNDLNPSNILMKGTTPKFNDFNIGELLTWNKKHNRPCKFESRFTNPQVSSLVHS